MSKSRKKIRIVFDASPLLTNKTGIAYYIERLATSIAKQYPDEVELVGFYYNFLGKRSSSHFPTAPNLRYHGVYFIPSKVIYQLRRWNIEIPVEVLTRTRADFILYTNFLGYPSLKRTPSAPVVHDLTYLDLPDYVSAKLRDDLTRFIPKEINRSKIVVTVSEFSKKSIAETYRISPDNILVTPIPPIKPVIHDEETRKDLLNKLGINRPFIAFVGTIEPRKNIIKLIRAYVQLPKELRDKYDLIIAGRIGWNCEAEEAELAKVTREGYNVKHLGYISDAEREVVYQSATLFATASHYEGFGMPILEAMSYGTPCAISDIPVFHEVAGTAADYFDQEKPSVIAAHLEAILTDDALRKRLGRQGKLQADSFKWSTVAEGLYKKIKQTLDEQK